MPGRAAEPEVIWARPERTGRGPKPAHSRRDVTEAAVRIADTDGLDAVSMRRIATDLGCGTMSLYNYVPRKEDLHELMVDHVSGEYALDTAPTGDWRTDLTAVAREARDLLRRHPWVIRLMTTGYAYGPNALRFLEHCLDRLTGLDLPGGTKMELIATLNGTVMTLVAAELATAERVRSLPWTERQEQTVRHAYLTDRLATGDYPRLAALFADAAPPPDTEEVFDRTVRRVLDSFVRG
ncbi:TetR/AcrR family transcriptional regulator [Streptomyces sp. NPDC090025]|uniref:TetR/AcrR family transcriptional regulator n=1 Tax=Streptomyces sp. NPDC090025 TaxID=3365922 RepID=UPI003832F15A